MKHRHHTPRILTLLTISVAVSLFLSCNSRTIYHKYQDTPVQGWEKNDTLSFHIPAVDSPGLYYSFLGMRICKDFPFTDLYLVVEQTILPRTEIVRDTVRCTIADEEGKLKSRGVTYHQYRFPISAISLNQGDSVRITVRHCMKRDIMPGISDIGIMLSK